MWCLLYSLLKDFEVMLLSATRDQLASLLTLQITSRWVEPNLRDLSDVVEESLQRIEVSIVRIALPGYSRNGQPFFNHLHGDQSAMWYYLVANTAYRRGHLELAEHCFLLNKAFNGIVCMYDTQLPEVFVLIHTVGAVLGKATYGNYFVAYQNVTVGTDSGNNQQLVSMSCFSAARSCWEIAR